VKWNYSSREDNVRRHLCGLSDLTTQDPWSRVTDPGRITAIVWKFGIAQRGGLRLSEMNDRTREAQVCPGMVVAQGSKRPRRQQSAPFGDSGTLSGPEGSVLQPQRHHPGGSCVACPRPFDMITRPLRAPGGPDSSCLPDMTGRKMAGTGDFAVRSGPRHKRICREARCTAL